jgi:hypothetical protein
MCASIVTPVPRTDPGSEGSLGYDYQAHVIARILIEMLLDRRILRVVCEYHEDVEVVRSGPSVEYVQVKKRDSGGWTLDGLTPSLGPLGMQVSPA